MTSSFCNSLDARLRDLGVETVRSETEMQSIRRLRYGVYVTELGKKVQSADHVKKEVLDIHDNGAAHLYVAKQGVIAGCIRVHPGGIPLALATVLQLWRIQNIPADRLCFISKLMVASPSRHTSITFRLIAAARMLIHESGYRACVCTTFPALVQMYRRIGMEAYTELIEDLELGPQYALLGSTEGASATILGGGRRSVLPGMLQC